MIYHWSDRSYDMSVSLNNNDEEVIFVWYLSNIRRRSKGFDVRIFKLNFLVNELRDSIQKLFKNTSHYLKSAVMNWTYKCHGNIPFGVEK